MTPTGIDYVELTNHAENERLPEIQGVDAHLIIRCVRDAQGRIYKDLKETDERIGHHYRMLIDDHDVTVAYEVDFDLEYNNKVAIVKTVFPATWAWWDTRRFERWNGKGQGR